MPTNEYRFAKDWSIPGGRAFKTGDAWPWRENLHIAKTLISAGVLVRAPKAQPKPPKEAVENGS